LNKEQYHLIQKYEADFLNLRYSTDRSDRESLLEYAQRTKQIDLAAELHYLIARDFGSLEDALQWLIIQSADPDESELLIRTTVLSNSFPNPVDSLVFAHYTTASEDEDIVHLIQSLPQYNGIIEAGAKSVMDEISTQVSSYDALELIASFEESYPNSIWHQAAYYYELYHLAQLKEYETLFTSLSEKGRRSAAHAYISSLFILSPGLRRDAAEFKSNQELLNLAFSCLDFALQSDSAPVLFDTYQGQDWQSRVSLQIAKAHYYALIGTLGRFGDEDDNIRLFNKLRKQQKKDLAIFDNIRFSSNDRGEEAELHFWRGKYLSLFKTRRLQHEAIREFGHCLILGSPRKRYDDDAYALIAGILAARKINTDPLDHLRRVFKYEGIIFEDTHALDAKRFTRVALADHDNDGLIDILFNGAHIFKNHGAFELRAHPDTMLALSLNASGGIWADFNKDGLLDFVSISHSAEGRGDALMKQNSDGSFVNVNPKTGDINDLMPTEGVAFVDIDGSGYPSLYMANYESWQSRSGYPDAFWHNQEGSFSNRSQSMGFLLPPYTDNPGLAGRGVAPADFDNDGKQEILVTNYRLNRNFLYKQADTLFVDLGALYSVAGTNKNGYFGHSIGADWGDFDNDGDLDLIIANLAHPRFMDISDKTMLLRNDGLCSRVIAADTLYFWQFTDITAQSGITYDELHAEPLFFDADNDGFLDIYITSVYENDRSYLYRNNGDGTFTDITYLSGARVYNGWSCAAGDLNRDGLIDLVIGSGSGTKFLSNVTAGSNQSLYLKPVHKGNQVELIEIGEGHQPHPNSPAFGTRVKLYLQDESGKEYSLIRELSSAKGSSTQNAPELHFGLGKARLIRYEIVGGKQ
jgi:tetratricopeptide (TPR) repeat protein